MEGEYQGVEGDHAFLGDLDLWEGEQRHNNRQSLPRVHISQTGRTGRRLTPGGRGGLGVAIE